MPQFTSPEELEQRFVREVYHGIAPGFKHARYKAWPLVEDFLKSQPAGSIIADIGCGSGKYLGLCSDSFVFGSDNCSKLVEIAHDRQHEVSVCDNLQLPYKDKCVDAVISIGVIHHFASAKRRLRALQELGRILRPGGTMLVYVWALEQKHRKFDAQDVLVPYTAHHRNRAKHKKSIHHQRSHDQNTPRENMHKKPLKGQGGLRKAKSCDMLFDRCQSSTNHNLDSENNIQGAKEHAVPSNIEFRVLKEIIQTLKNKKDNLITNLNAKVTKLYPEKEKSFANGLLSAVVSRIFDKDMKNPQTKTENPFFGDQEPAPESGIPRVTEFVSSLIKRLFNEKNGETSLDSNDEQVLNCSEDSPDHDVLKFNEEVLKESLYDSLAAWAREKMGILYTREKIGNTVNHKSYHFGRANLPREESCDSESSEGDWYGIPMPCILASESSTAMSGGNPVEEATRPSKVPLHLFKRLTENISSSSDTDSDASSSLEHLNFDSGISDSDLQERPVSPLGERRRAYSTPCYDNTTQLRSGIEKPMLQRYYHVFSEKELPDLIEDGVDCVDVLKEYYDHGNWAVIAEKQ